MKKIRAGLVGSAGFSAEVLVRLLASHKQVKLTTLVSDSHSGVKISDIHRSLRGITGQRTVSYEPEKLISDCDVIFFSKPHTVNMKDTTDLVMLARKRGKKIRFIDLSGDFRLKKPQDYEKWYIKDNGNNKLSKIWGKQKSSGAYRKILKNSVYGIPEINGPKIRNACFVANPGCYPTGALLGIMPLVTAGAAGVKDIIINAYSGVSGAGRTGKPGGSGAAISGVDNIVPYKIAVHPHIPEIEQELSSAGLGARVSFSPHVGTFKYGILSTINLKMTGNLSMKKLHGIYGKFYKRSPFIRIRGEKYPQISDVTGTNFCDIGFTIDGRNKRIVVITAIDNLHKGASGQAVQNMNIMFGAKETEGLV